MDPHQRQENSHPRKECRRRGATLRQPLNQAKSRTHVESLSQAKRIEWLKPEGDIAGRTRKYQLRDARNTT